MPNWGEKVNKDKNTGIDPCRERELEKLADAYLLDACGNGVGEYPFYTNKQLKSKIRKDKRMLPFLAERGFFEESSELYSDIVDEIKSLLFDIGTMSGLSDLEGILLGLLFLGLTQKEIAETTGINLRTIQRKIYKLRKKILHAVPEQFWQDLHKHNIYHRPNLCCSPGLEDCKKNGLCPYGKLRGASKVKVRRDEWENEKT